MAYSKRKTRFTWKRVKCQSGQGGLRSISTFEMIVYRDSKTTAKTPKPSPASFVAVRGSRRTMIDNTAVRIRLSRPMGTTLLPSSIPIAIIRASIPLTPRRPVRAGILINFGDMEKPLPRRSIAIVKTTIQVMFSTSIKLMLSTRHRDTAAVRT